MRKTGLFILLSVALSSCGLLGVHFNVHNPKKAGKYPEDTKKNDLLAKTSRYRTCFDVYHNKITVGIEDPKTKHLRGIVTVSAKAVTNFDTLQLDLYKNMKVTKLDSEGKDLQYWREEGAIFIKMPQTVKAGTNFSIEVAYEGNPVSAKRPPWDGGFVWKKDKDGNPWIGVACETEGSSMWWPGKDVMNDEADSTDIRIIVPPDLTAVSNGVLKSTTTIDGHLCFHWHVSYPINNYNVTLYIGNFKLLQDNYVSAVSKKITELNHYVLPYNYEKAKTHFQQVKKYLAFYEKTFGEYPWQRDGFKLVESPFAGMEHQSAIAYGNGYKNDFQDTFDYIILHETAHEWWGNAVTAADLSDGWIHEGFASYCEALYVESIWGSYSYLNYMNWQRYRILNKRPVVRQREIRYFDYHDEDIYNKGSWVLHSLRTTINNDTLFFDILKTFYQQNVQKQILSETFIDLVNKKTGNDYGWFFHQYLFNREAPFWEYCWENDNLYFKWTHCNDDFILPIKIKVNNKTITLYPTTKVQKIELSNENPSFYDNSNMLYYGTKKNKGLKSEFNRSR